MLLDKLQSDLIVAMKSGEKNKVDTLRFLIAAVKKFAIDNYPPASSKGLTDEDVLKIIAKQVKTHKESIEVFSKANRIDLVEKESQELKILEAFLPQQLSDEEIRIIVENIVKTGVNNFGQVMGQVMKQVAGKADGKRVQVIVKTIIQKL